MILDQEGGSIEKIDMRGPPGLEHVDDVLGLGCQAAGRVRKRIRVTPRQHGGESRRAETIASGAEKRTAIEDCWQVGHVASASGYCFREVEEEATDVGPGGMFGGRQGGVAD